MSKRRKTYIGRVYLGGGRYKWVGGYATKKARDDAVAAARTELLRRPSANDISCEEWAASYLARYRQRNKDSSHHSVVQALRAFRREFGDRPIRSISRFEAIDYATKMPPSTVPRVITLFNAAVDAELIDRNPFRGLAKPTVGRAEEPSPTDEEFARLLAACDVHGWYADRMRAMIEFPAYGMGFRPGELFALEWPDIDLATMRVRVSRRVYRGQVDLPKSNQPRTIALTPPARDVLLRFDSRKDGGLVFRAKRGGRMSQQTLAAYWGKVTARASLDFDFYLATKHYCVHYMHTVLQVSPRAIAAQMRWRLANVLKLLEVYGHGDIGALEEVDRAYDINVVSIRDASKTHRGAGRAS
jgi:integrase